MRSLAVRSREPEAMDADDLDPVTYAAVMADLDRVNALLLSSRPTLSFLKRALAGRRAFRLLDVGYGGGEMLRSISRWARRRGIAAELVGIDLNPRSAPAARAATPLADAIDYRTGDYADLAGENWDIVVSNFVAHHMTEPQLTDFLRFMEREARLGWIVSDLHRLDFAHTAFPLLARVMRWHPMVRADGTLSVARSFRRAEWRDILRDTEIEGARIVSRLPALLCVERLKPPCATPPR